MEHFFLELDPPDEVMRSWPHVVVVGGGFAGLKACHTLARQPVRVTLIDKRNFNLFQPLLYQVASGLVSEADVVGIEPEARELVFNDRHHKHGWIDDTHGDAAVVFSPGGAYVLVTVMHGPDWLNFEQSAPLIGEISRTVYNYFNPQAPLEAVRQIEGVGDVATCNRNLLGSPVITELTGRAP